MFLRQELRPFAVVIFLALLLAPVVGFSHALVSHAHGHVHDGVLHAEIWEGIQGTLSRKDMVLPPIFFAFFVFIAPRFVFSSRPVLQSFVLPLAHALHRGILPHRKFG
jgi:hypothetical protein